MTHSRISCNIYVEHLGAAKAQWIMLDHGSSRRS